MDLSGISSSENKLDRCVVHANMMLWMVWAVLLWTLPTVLDGESSTVWKNFCLRDIIIIPVMQNFFPNNNLFHFIYFKIVVKLGLLLFF